LRLLPLEQRVVEDLARWYGPAGRRTYKAAVQAVSGWLGRLRDQLDRGQVGPEWRLCDAQPPLRLEGCWRVQFSPWDRAKRDGPVIPAPGPRDARIVGEVIMRENRPAFRVLAIGPKYAGRGSNRTQWVYRHADERRRHPYSPKGGGNR